MRSLSFLNSWLLLGLGTVAIPIVIHLINRRRAYMHRFAAIEFLLRSQRRVAMRFRLRQLLLLLIRCAALVFLCSALAKPVLSSFGVTPTGAHQPTSVVIIVDNSYSMRCMLGGQSLFERARVAARNLLNTLRSTDNAALFLGPAPSPSSSTGLTFDLASLLRDLESASCSFGTTDLPGWVKPALSVLRESRLSSKRVCVLTDGARHAWRPFDHAQGRPELVEGRREAVEELATQLKAANVQCDVLDVSAGQKLRNVAVQELRAIKTPADVFSVTATVVNHSNRDAWGLPCHISVDGKRVGSGFIDVRAGATSLKEFSCGALPWGYHVCEVGIEPDPAQDQLAADDARLVSLMMHRPINVLLVDGAPGPHVYASETFYLERALNPEHIGGGPIRATVVAETQLRLAPLDAFDCVFLCNANTLSGEKIREINSFLERGGGLFITVGDNVDASYYNRYWGAFLPQPLRNPEDFPTSSPTTFSLNDDEKNSLANALRSQGIQFGHVSVRKAFVLETASGPPATRIISYTSGQKPALVERQVGLGLVLLLTTTVDRDWTNLPISTAFLPLMQTAVRHMAGRTEAQPELDTVVGRPVELSVPADCKRVRIINPAGSINEFDVAQAPVQAVTVSPRHRVTVSPCLLPGAYGITFLGRTPRGAGLSARGEERLGFVVNLETEAESDLQKISRKDLTRFGVRLVGLLESGQVTMNDLEFGVERGLWAPLLAGLLFLLVGECLLARKP